MTRYLVLILGLLFVLASYSRGTPVQRPAAFPEIPSSFIALVYQNYSNTASPGIAVQTLVRLVSNKISQTVLMNITTTDRIELMYLYRFAEKKIFEIAPDDKGKTLCKIIPNSVNFSSFFAGINTAVLTDHDDHLNVDTWTIGKEVVIQVSSDNPNKPVSYKFTNNTVTNHFSFLSFQDVTPPLTFFSVPTVCSKHGVYQREGMKPAATGMFDYLFDYLRHQ